MQGCKSVRSTFAIAVLAIAMVCGATTASAATGGTAPGSSGGPSSRGSASGGDARTGGVAPAAIRQPSGPVNKTKKKKKKKKKRRRPAHHAPSRPPAPAPAPAPSSPPKSGSTADVPPRYLATYKRAGAKYGVDWRILAAIGKNESDHGRSTAPGVHSGRNYANCCSGPMQICTVKACSNTWGYYAVDGDNDGVISVYDPDDAIYAAAALVRDLKAIVGSNPRLVLAAYNAGPGNVQKYKGVPPFAETQAYVKKGIAYIASLS